MGDRIGLWVDIYGILHSYMCTRWNQLQCWDVINYQVLAEWFAT